MVKIALIRHGITDWNVERRCQGQTDVPLNEEGRSQARLLAGRIAGEHWDAAYSSDLSRALETARTATAGKGIEIQTDERLREMFCGEIEGLTETERVARWGNEWNKLDLGVESDEAIAARGAACLNELADLHPDGSVLVFSHGALIGVTLKKLVPHVDTEAHMLNTSVTILTCTPDGWDCELFNCAKHLDAADEEASELSS